MVSLIVSGDKLIPASAVCERFFVCDKAHSFVSAGVAERAAVQTDPVRSSAQEGLPEIVGWAACLTLILMQSKVRNEPAADDCFWVCPAVVVMMQSRSGIDERSGAG